MAKKNRIFPQGSGDTTPVPSTTFAGNPDAPSEADTAPPASESSPQDSRERIAARAYALYLERGGEHGRATEDWLAAERELSEPNGRPPSSSDQ
jgi:hypothetical protein